MPRRQKIGLKPEVKKSVNKKEQKYVVDGTVDNNMKRAIRRILSGSTK